MERKAAIVRWWFVALAVALLGLIDPALWFACVPIGFFFPGSACCSTPCTLCNPEYTARMQVDISGMADSAGTSCNLWDGTYSLEIDSFQPASCSWLYAPTLSIGCPGSNDDEMISMQIYGEFGIYYSQIRTNNCWTGGTGDPDKNIWRYTHGASLPDCSSFSGLGHTWISSGGSNCSLFSFPCCDGSGATATATAIA